MEFEKRLVELLQQFDKEYGEKFGQHIKVIPEVFYRENRGKIILSIVETLERDDHSNVDHILQSMHAIVCLWFGIDDTDLEQH